jgi:hypothetical protein
MIKVPVLFFHYLEHLREDPNITFSGFLDMHYMHGIVYDEDYARDMQLPFKVIDSAAISAFVVEEISIYENDFKAAGKHGSKSLYAFNSYVQDPRVIGIFHPPRLA